MWKALPVQKAKLLLLDADVIIEAHELGVWEDIKRTYDVAVPSIIVSEARYFRSEHGGAGINLKRQVDAGEIKKFEGTVDELEQTFSNIRDTFMAGLDDGEKEAIALIAQGRCPEYLFCSGDINGIQAMALLGMAARSISFEQMVKGIKLKGKVSISPPLAEKAHAHHLREGNKRRNEGIYFKKPI